MKGGRCSPEHANLLFSRAAADPSHLIVLEEVLASESDELVLARMIYHFVTDDVRSDLRPVLVCVVTKSAIAVCEPVTRTSAIPSSASHTSPKNSCWVRTALPCWAV